MIYREIFLKQKQSPVWIQTTQFSNAIGLHFAIADWEVPEGALANLYVQKPSGTEVFTAGTISGNDISFTITTQMTAEAGVSQCQVKITADEKVQNSFVFLLDVQECIIDDEAIESVDEFDALNTLLNSVQSTIDAAEAATQAALDAATAAREPVAVGAKNLLLNTTVDAADVHMTGATGHYGATQTSNTDGVVTLSSGSTFNWFVGQSIDAGMFGFEAGEYYYFSGKVKSSKTGTMTIQARGASTTSLGTISVVANTWVGFRQMFQVGSSETKFNVGLTMSSMSGQTVQLTDMQLEKATVPSVYRPALEDLIANTAANLSAAVSSLTALVGVINGGSSTKGYINQYNNDAHKVGMTYTVQNSQTVPGMVIDGTSYYLLRNIIQTSIDGDTNHVGLISSINVVRTTSPDVWKLQVKITVDGTTFTKYLTLANS